MEDTAVTLSAPLMQQHRHYRAQRDISTQAKVRPKRADPQQQKPYHAAACLGEGTTSWSLNRVTFFQFPGGFRCIPRSDATLQEVLDQEWSLLPQEYSAIVNGKCTSPRTALQAIPPGLPVRILFKLRGGAASAHKKLRELLLTKGVTEAEVQSRIQEVISTIGDQGLQECFANFDPWQMLKNRCQGKVRLAKAAEQRPTKPKKQQDEVDPLQLRDPWSEAIQSKQLKPDPTFFVTRSGEHPAILQAVTHGTTGIVIADAREAAMWAKNSESVYSDELAVVVLGQVDIPDPRRPMKTLEFPCYDQHGARLLVKGTVIDLGDTQLKVKGGDQPLQMSVIESQNVACELHSSEVDDWVDASRVPVRFLRQCLGLTAEDILHTWGRRAYRNRKAAQRLQEADTIFLMLRLRAAAVEPTLKKAIPGVYVCPRSEEGMPHPDFKVIWLPDKSLSDLRLMATFMQGCFGVVRTKTGGGIRVKCPEYTQLRQKLCPEWSPQDATPYDVQLPYKFELHHVHPGAGKVELQSVINETGWKALVLRQKRPMQWLVAASGPPVQDTILTQHGCILILQSVDGDKTSAKGKGKGKKGGNQVVVGGHAIPPRPVQSASPVPTASKHDGGPKDPNGPIQTAFLQLEEKVQERLTAMKKEATASHAMLEQDIKSMRADFAQHVEQQQHENVAIRDRIAGVETALGSQLAGFMSGLTDTLQQQKQDLSTQLKAGQDSLRLELTHEMRQQLSTIRKRTPSPAEDKPEDKRLRG